MITRIERTEFPRHSRLLMLSDIHGHRDVLENALEKARFSGADTLVIAGDLIEKGTQSLGVLRLVAALRKEYRVHVLIGNVDMWMLRFFDSDGPDAQRELLRVALNAKKWWGGTLLEEMCAEMGADFSEETDVGVLLPDIRARYAAELAFLRGLPTILDTPRMTFVHGGLPHENLSALEGADNHPLVKFDDFLNSDLTFRKYVVVGHWPVALYREHSMDANPLIDREKHIICLDGGCGVKRDGQLNVLMLPNAQSDDFFFVSADELPVVTALSDQPESEGAPVCVKWTDPGVELLSRGPELSRVRRAGREITVPTELLFERDGKTCCEDVTDYRLPVRKGDALSLILKAGGSVYAKKNGVSGWYDGKCAMGL